MEHPIRKLGGLNAIKKEMGIAVSKPKPSIVLTENEQLLLLKYEKRQLETFVKKLLKKKALDDNIIEAVKNTALAIPKAPFIKSKIIAKANKTEQSAVLIIADPHCREVVKPDICHCYLVLKQAGFGMGRQSGGPKRLRGLEMETHIECLCHRGSKRCSGQRSFWAEDEETATQGFWCSSCGAYRGVDGRQHGITRLRRLRQAGLCTD